MLTLKVWVHFLCFVSWQLWVSHSSFILAREKPPNQRFIFYSVIYNHHVWKRVWYHQIHYKRNNFSTQLLAAPFLYLWERRCESHLRNQLPYWGFHDCLQSFLTDLKYIKKATYPPFLPSFHATEFFTHSHHIIFHILSSKNHKLSQGYVYLWLTMEVSVPSRCN